MEQSMRMNKEDIMEAVQLYLALKGYSVKGYKFDTGWSYDRVLFDVQVKSWLRGLNLSVERNDELKERVKKNIGEVINKS